MPTFDELVQLLQPIKALGATHAEIRRVVSLDVLAFEVHDLTWCSDKNADKLRGIKTGTVILSLTAFHAIEHEVQSSVNWIIVDAPRRAFMRVLQTFFVSQPSRSISQYAHLHESVQLGKECSIGHGVVIEEGCRIGNHVVIHHNTVIHAGTVVEDEVSIGSNCTIGGVGFGYEKDEEGNFECIPHIGNVHICSKVEIGNNTTIDRAVIGSTYIGKNVKVDNLVHIAHGVQIGENSLVIAHAMLAGSTKIGRNVWVAPSTSILQKTTIGDDVLIGMGSIVLKDIPANKIVAGTPARILRDQYPDKRDH
jgi:UDP-3-O-[3-hydroxymyristoyl] glucosamine N-acyltransferase